MLYLLLWRKTHSPVQLAGIDCTSPGQNHWAIKGTESPALSGGGGTAQPAQPGINNNALDHLGELPSQRTTFGPNSSTPASRLAWQARRAGHCSHIGFSWDHFGELTYSNKLTLTAYLLKRSLALKILRGNLQPVQQKGAPLIATY